MPELDVTVDAPRPASHAPRRSILRQLFQSFHSRRHTILITFGAVLATLLLMAGSVLAWRLYDGWRIGRIELTTEGAPLVCQVLAERSDTAIGDPFDLVTRAVVSLPAGEYRLRVSGTGRLSRTYRFAVNRGETQTHAISIDEGRLLGGELGPQTADRTNSAKYRFLSRRRQPRWS